MYSPAPADLNLDGAKKPLSFSSAIRGPHGKEWTLADEQELIKLLIGHPQLRTSCNASCKDPHLS